MYTCTEWYSTSYIKYAEKTDDHDSEISLDTGSNVVLQIFNLNPLQISYQHIMTQTIRLPFDSA